MKFSQRQRFPEDRGCFFSCRKGEILELTLNRRGTLLIRQSELRCGGVPNWTCLFGQGILQTHHGHDPGSGWCDREKLGCFVTNFQGSQPSLQELAYGWIWDRLTFQEAVFLCFSVQAQCFQELQIGSQEFKSFLTQLPTLTQHPLMFQHSSLWLHCSSVFFGFFLIIEASSS